MSAAASCAANPNFTGPEPVVDHFSMSSICPSHSPTMSNEKLGAAASCGGNANFTGAERRAEPVVHHFSLSSICPSHSPTMSNEKLGAAVSCGGNANFTGAERRLEGKVAIITGGATGIGEAIVRLFTKHGATVIIADIAEEGGRKLAGSLSPPAIYVRCDVSNEEDMRAAVDLAMEKYGQLDIMYNNAGTIEFLGAESVAEYEMEQFDRIMRVNVRGVMAGMKHAARVMIPRKKGCIISTASVAGVIAGMATHGYTASKHAIIGLTKNGAAELGKYGIRVNAVSPYGVATDLAVNYMKQGNASVVSEEDKAAMEAFCNSTANLEGATLKAEDIAEAGLYLASDEAKYVSGHNLVVDGGFTVVNHSWKLYR